MGLSSKQRPLLAKSALLQAARGVALAVLLMPMLTLSHAQADSGRKLQYNRDIRPILSENCFQCHGPDKNNRQAGLRLDVAQSALDKRAIVPGKPKQSALLTRIYATDASVMPPVSSHKSLTPQQQNLLTRWIAEGGEYQAHWAYLPPVRPAVPVVHPLTNFPVRNPIDAFILDKLNTKRIAPSPEADKRTLIRRVSLDLIGIPPTPAEVAAFVADKSPNTYEKVVDRLLASPHYGERMAVPWLDLARYADTVGFHGDQNQNVWAYRDYVIDSFNRNKPFDQFTIEQIAGDLLPNATPETRAATCFNRLNMMTREGGAQAKEYLAKYAADRVRTVSMTWLGSTFGCAECHDHKYDPISQKDFYALGAFFADMKQWGVYADYGYTPNPDLRGYNNDYPFPPEIKVESRYLKTRIAQEQAQIGNIALSALEATQTNPAAQAALNGWQKSASAFLTNHPDGWEIAAASEIRATNAPAMKPKPPLKKAAVTVAVSTPVEKASQAKSADKPVLKAVADATEASELRPELDGSILLTDKAGGSIELTLHPSSAWLACLRLEVLPHAANGNSIFRKGVQAATLTLAASVLRADGKREPVLFRYADANDAEPRYNSGFEVVGIQKGWKLSAEHASRAHVSSWLLDKPISLAFDDTLVVTVPNAGEGCIRLASSPFIPEQPNAPVFSTRYLAQLRGALEGSKMPLDRGLLATQYLLGAGQQADAYAQAKSLQNDIFNCRSGITPVLVTEATKPMTMRVLPRGNWQDESGEIVQPATPHFLPALQAKSGFSSQTLTRLDLARWIVSPENPLTARVFVNRLWKQFFGNGLSAQVEDLGAQGEWPTHPELLDWLACNFVAEEKGERKKEKDPVLINSQLSTLNSSWNVKRLVRLIVTSSTYRQSSSLRPELRDSDPNNRLLASQNPRRLEAEFVRDNALAVAGLLNPEIGGPPCKPYQPAGYYANIQFPDRDYVATPDDGQYRRGVYMHRQRTFLHPMLANFDAPSREDCIASRIVANTPQQALTLLNDPTFVEAARVFAAQLLNVRAGGNGAKAGEDSARLEAAFQRALARSPKPKEKQSLLTFLTTIRKAYQEQPDDARKLLTTGLTPLPQNADRIELAAWTNVCRIILNLNETITRY